MLSAETIKNIATKNQTTEVNTAREYMQHVFLGYLYQKKGSEKLLFKGGTALRVVYGSPRFSEDLDYRITKLTDREMKYIIESVVDDMGGEGFEFRNIKYHKTSGGYIIPLETMTSSWPVRIELNLSNRKGVSDGEFQLISGQYVPPYTINVLAEEELVAEKIDALLTRSKPRDYYDLYFILRAKLVKKPILDRKEELIKAVESIDNTKIKNELKVFLPASHLPTIANLKKNLDRELTRL